MTAPAIVYARFSSLEQAKGFSLERQITQGAAYAERENLHVESVLKDEGRSAFHGANRAEGSALFEFEVQARAGQHRGKTLVVENIDRLSRQGAKAAAQLIWALNEQGVDVATWHDGIVYRAGNNGDLMELFSVIVKAQMAYEESLKKSQRSAASWVKRRSKIAAGDKSTLVGQPPAWIEERNGVYALNEYRTGVLNEIFDLYIAGQGAHRIMKLLNGRREPVWTTNNRPKEGQGWYLGYIHRLLVNRAVLGEYRTAADELVSPDYYPQAVTHSKFAQAADVREGKGRAGGFVRFKMKNLLSGLVTCSVCGGVAAYEDKGKGFVRRHTLKSGEVREYRYDGQTLLRCDSNRRGHGCSNSGKWRYQLVEQLVLDKLLSFAVEDAVDPEVAGLEERLARETAQLDQKRIQLANLLDALAEGAPKSLVARVGATEAEIATLEGQMRVIEGRLASLEAKPLVSDDIESVRLLRDNLECADEDVRLFARASVNKTLNRVVDSITLEANGSFVVLTDMFVAAYSREGELQGGQAL